MLKSQSVGLTALLGCLCLALTSPAILNSKDQVLNPEALVAEHLKSLGKPESVATIKSRLLFGDTSVDFIQGARGNLGGGQFIFASEGPRLGIVMKYGDINYPGEYFAFDGQEVTVGYVSPGQRSPVADFIFRYNSIVKEGFLGGVLSVSWPLLDIAKNQPSFKYSPGTLDGHPVHELEYRPQKSTGNLSIKLYFDEKTFRHIRTEYSVRIKNDLTAMRRSSVPGRVPDDAPAPTGAGPQQRSIDGSAGPTVFESAPDSIYLLVEKFDNFSDVGGLTLPFSYTLEYSVEGHGSSFLARWRMKSNGTVTNNGQISPEFFRAQK